MISRTNTKTPEGRFENATLWSRQEHGQIKGTVFKERFVQDGKPFNIFGDGDRDLKLPAGRGSSNLIPGRTYTIGKSDQQLADEEARLQALKQKVAADELAQQREAARQRVRQKAFEAEVKALKREAQPWDRKPMTGRVEEVYLDENRNRFVFVRDGRGVLWEGEFNRKDPGLKKGDQVTWDLSKSQEKAIEHERSLNKGPERGGGRGR